jgi:hypothetical protein
MNPVSDPHVRGDRTSRLAGALLAVGAVSVLVAGAVGSVSAASPEPPAAGERHRFCAEEWRAALADPSVETLRAVGDCEIERRLVTLDQLDVRVESAPQLTELHKHQLQDENDVNPASYDAVRTGLRELKAEIDSETDLRALRAGIASIATDFRVYLLVVPKTHLVGGADAVDRATVKLGQLAHRLTDGIETAEAAGHDMSEARGLLSELERKTAEAASLVSGMADRLMPISPADYNAGPGKAALESARSDLRAARDLVRGARADARQIVEILKALNPA